MADLDISNIRSLEAEVTPFVNKLYRRVAVIKGSYSGVSYVEFSDPGARTLIAWKIVIRTPQIKTPGTLFRNIVYENFAEMLHTRDPRIITKIRSKQDIFNFFNSERVHPHLSMVSSARQHVAIRAS
jgi:hypothetical protein